MFTDKLSAYFTRTPDLKYIININYQYMAARANKPEEFTQALKKITYGFYILTTQKSAEELSTRSVDYIAAGTVCWVSQVSFNPPMLMVAVQKDSDLNETIQKSRVFAINYIGSANEALIQPFSHKTEVDDQANKLNGYSFEAGVTGSPLITACPVAVECKLTDSLTTNGDHVIFIGEVVSATIRDENAKMISDLDVDFDYGG
jgi:flavin reductase (DIM6/NTAB) family NADH-FMN oxidoreductase RutF